MMGKVKSFLLRILNKLMSQKEKQWERSLRRVGYGCTKKRRKRQLIISLTSYEPRLSFLDLPLRSLLKQKKKPDRIMVWLSCDFDLMPSDVRALEKYGIEYRHAPFDAKSHKKYLFVMQQFPNDVVVTVDDDVVYPRSFLSALWKTHARHPDCIIARRVHEMRFDEIGRLAPYSKWGHEWNKTKGPSFLLCGTGCGGILYPPNSLSPMALNFKLAEKVALSADDLWLKYMSLLNGTRTMWVRNRFFMVRLIPQSQAQALSNINVLCGGNDVAISKLESLFHDDIDCATKGAFYPPHPTEIG